MKKQKHSPVDEIVQAPKPQFPVHLVDFNTLEKTPGVLIQLEKDWNLINSLDSDAYIQWLEKSDPIQVENYRLYYEYRNERNKPKPKYVLFTKSIIHFIETNKIVGSILFLLWRVIGAVGITLIFMCLAGTGFAALAGIVYIGVQIYLKNQFLAAIYLVFVMTFIPILLNSFD